MLVAVCRWAVELNHRSRQWPTRTRTSGSLQARDSLQLPVPSCSEPSHTRPLAPSQQASTAAHSRTLFVRPIHSSRRPYSCSRYYYPRFTIATCILRNIPSANLNHCRCTDVPKLRNRFSQSHIDLSHDGGSEDHNCSFICMIARETFQLRYTANPRSGPRHRISPRHPLGGIIP